MSLRSGKPTITGLGDKQVKQKTAQQLGKEFEQDLQEIMRNAISRYSLAFVRLYDTRSAGSYLPEQPGDFLMTFQAVAYLIECKSSVKHASLASSRSALTDLCTDGQIAAMRIWHRAGAIPVVLFRHMDNPVIEVWNGDYLAWVYNSPRTKPDKSRCSVIEFSESALLTRLSKMAIGATSC